MNSAATTETVSRRSECPGTAELWKWLERGGASPEGVAEHIETCRICCQTLDRLTQSTVVESYVQSVSQRPVGLSFLSPSGRPGDLGLLDQYAIERELNSGGMGVVFRAWDTRLHRPVAIKLMRLFDSRTAIARFHREARAAARLTHENIVPIYSVSETRDGRPFLVMPLIPGESLRQRLNRTSVAPRDAAEWLRQVATGLQVAHEAGLIHRDIKPANILLDSDTGRARLTDFGLVRESEGQSLTQPEGILGTPEFMSPEQIRNETICAQSDIYSLGITLYQCLTGVTPFRGPSLEVLQQHLEEMPLAPSVLRPGIPRDLETICQKSIRKDPASRYESARAFAEDLARFLNGVPILARPASFAERSRFWIRKHPWQTLSALLAGGVFLGTAAGALMISRSYEEERKASRALEHLRDEADQSFQLTRSQLATLVSRIKDQLLQVPQAEQIAIQSVRDVARLYSDLNRLRPTDQQVAEEYLAALKDQWYAEWLYEGDAQEHQALEQFQAESVRLLQLFPASSTVAALRAELLLDLAIESENAGDQQQADQYQQQGRDLLANLAAKGSHADSLAVRTLVWKAAWQEYQMALQRDLPAARIAELAHSMVRAQQSVIDLTPASQQTEAICIGSDQMSRLAEALIDNSQSPEAISVIEQARSLLNTLPDSATRTLEVRQASVRILRAELQLARAENNLKLQDSTIEQLVTANRSIVADFPDGEVQLKALAEALCEHAEFQIQQGRNDSAGKDLTEIEWLLNQINSNPAVAGWTRPLHATLEALRQRVAQQQ